MAKRTNPRSTQAERRPPELDEEEGEGWTIARGKASLAGIPAKPFYASGVEILGYNNPFSQKVERVWYDGKLVFALSCGDLDMAEAGDVKVAKEYQPVFSVTLDRRGKPKGEPEKVPGQYNIYDSVPGQKGYSPIWQFYYVLVPRDYQPNSLRSAKDCERSGYPIYKSNTFEN